MIAQIIKSIQIDRSDRPVRRHLLAAAFAGGIAVGARQMVDAIRPHLAASPQG
jgi:hypothetical protein